MNLRRNKNENKSLKIFKDFFTRDKFANSEFLLKKIKLKYLLFSFIILIILSLFNIIVLMILRDQNIINEEKILKITKDTVLKKTNISNILNEKDKDIVLKPHFLNKITKNHNLRILNNNDNSTADNLTGYSSNQNINTNTNNTFNITSQEYINNAIISQQTDLRYFYSKSFSICIFIFLIKFISTYIFGFKFLSASKKLKKFIKRI